MYRYMIFAIWIFDMLIMYINVRTVYILGGVLFVTLWKNCHDFRKNQLLRVLTSEQRHDAMIFQE